MHEETYLFFHPPRHSVSFGESFGCLENIEGRVPFADAVGDLLGICSMRLVDPLWKFREAVTSVGKKARELKFVMRERIRTIVERRRREGLGDKKDMLQLLLEATDDDGNLLTEEYLVDIILTFTVCYTECKGRYTTKSALITDL